MVTCSSQNLFYSGCKHLLADTPAALFPLPPLLPIFLSSINPFFPTVITSATSPSVISARFVLRFPYKDQIQLPTSSSSVGTFFLCHLLCGDTSLLSKHVDDCFNQDWVMTRVKIMKLINWIIVWKFQYRLGADNLYLACCVSIFWLTMNIAIYWSYSFNMKFSFSFQSSNHRTLVTNFAFFKV